VSEGIKTALITGGFMLAVIILNELAFLFREKRIRKKEFFNQFFPERIKAHEKIVRIMTEGGLTNIDPKRDTVIVIMEHVKRLNGAAHNALSQNILFADKSIGWMLSDLISAGNAIINQGGINEKLEQESEFAESVTRFNLLYYKLLGALRKKSGVKLIEEVFDSIPQKGGMELKDKKKKSPGA
jgi:hypothetical protein